MSRIWSRCWREDGETSIQRHENLLKGRIMSCLFKGVHYEMLIEVADGHGGSFTFMAHSTIAEQIGMEMYLDVDPDNIHIMKKSSIETMTELEHRLENDPSATEEMAGEDEE